MVAGFWHRAVRGCAGEQKQLRRQASDPIHFYPPNTDQLHTEKIGIRQSIAAARPHRNSIFPEKQTQHPTIPEKSNCM